MRNKNLDEDGSLREREKFPSSTCGKEVINVYQLSAENAPDARLLEKLLRGRIKQIWDVYGCEAAYIHLKFGPFRLWLSRYLFDVSLTLVFYTGNMSGQYKVYLLRIWQVGEKGEREIRAMLEDPRTHETVGFSSLAELLQYLEKTHICDQVSEGQKPLDPYN